MSWSIKIFSRITLLISIFLCVSIHRQSIFHIYISNRATSKCGNPCTKGILWHAEQCIQLAFLLKDKTKPVQYTCSHLRRCSVCVAKRWVYCAKRWLCCAKRWLYCAKRWGRHSPQLTLYLLCTLPVGGGYGGSWGKLLSSLVREVSKRMWKKFPTSKLPRRC